MQYSAHAKKRPYLVLVLVFFLLLACVLVWVRLLGEAHGNVMRVSFLDVGQGDAVFIETPNGRQVLIDGGAGRVVLRELGTVMSFFDRSIDIVMASHPDSDHIGGLPDVFDRYNVSMYVDSGVQGDSALFSTLHERVAMEGLHEVVGRKGAQFVIDDGVTMEVLFPDRDVTHVETNTGSLIVRLVYGDTSFLFTGDAPVGIETYLTYLYGGALKSTVLKLGHHGSDTSTADAFLGYVEPEYAVISVGCDNSYGHPSKETIERLERFGIVYVSTCEKGTITFESDGASVSLK